MLRPDYCARDRLNAIDHTFFITAYPLWSLLAITVDIVAPWGPCA